MDKVSLYWLLCWAIFLLPAPLQAQKDSLLQLYQQYKKIPPQDTLAYLTTLQALAKRYYLNSIDSSLYFCQEALLIAGKSNQPKIVGDMYNLIGNNYYTQGEYDDALKSYLNALKVRESIQDERGVGTSLNNIGLIYEAQKRYDKAIAYHRLSIRKCLKTGDTITLHKNYINTALAYYRQEQYDSALVYLQRVVKAYPSNQYKREHVLAIMHVGEVYLLQKQYTTALTYYEQVLAFREQLNRFDACFTMAGAAQCYYQLQKPALAFRYAQEALKIATELKAQWEVQRSALVLAKLFAAERNFEEAYRYQVLHQNYADSVFSKERSREINLLKLQYQESENQRLVEQNELQQQKASQQKDLLWLLAVMALLLLIIISLLVYFYFQKQKQNKLLSAIGHTKDRIFSIISHDLRGPLANIKALLSLMSGDYITAEEQKMLSTDLTRSLDVTLSTLDNLLIWAKGQLQNSYLSPRSEQVFLKDEVENMIALWADTAAGKQIHISHQVPEDSSVWADGEHVRLIIRNLLSNAIKFTPQGGSIYIKLAATPKGQVALAVEDTGKGMSAEVLTKLFDEEQIVSTRGTANEKGTGLGLKLCRHCAKLNKGDILVQSQKGAGSTFTLLLPQQPS
jgi:signal transduction histidine kinase